MKKETNSTVPGFEPGYFDCRSLLEILIYSFYNEFRIENKIENFLSKVLKYFLYFEKDNFGATIKFQSNSILIVLFLISMKLFVSCFLQEIIDY